MTTALSVNVQDRRHHTRTLMETRQRKSALLALDSEEVVHRLRAMRPPEGLLDSEFPKADVEDFQSRARSRGGDSASNEEGKELPPVPPPPRTFKQWADKGFPTTSWRPLLSEELYHPLEAQKMILTNKYTPSQKLKSKMKDNAEPDS